MENLGEAFDENFIYIPALKCNKCGKLFKGEKGAKAHLRNSHCAYIINANSYNEEKTIQQHHKDY